MTLFPTASIFLIYKVFLREIEKDADKVHPTIVVGGGAAGMMGAIAAAQRGEKVVLLEGNNKLGRKILISGNGRCNLTNIDADNARHYHSGMPPFVKPALQAFSVRDTLNFFADLGIAVKEEKRGRLFPQSDQAQAIVDVLEDRMVQLGVDIVRGEKVVQMNRAEKFSAVGISGKVWEGNRAILASGGVSLEKLGADRSGIDIAVGLGHSCTRLYPGLVSLESPDDWVHRMQGCKVWAEVRSRISSRRSVVDTDDLLFTKYGISGFTVLNLSAQLVPLLDRAPVEIEINLFPGKSAEQIGELLKTRWQQNPHRSLAFSFAGLLSNKIVPPLLLKMELDGRRRVDSLSKAQRWHLAQGLVKLPIVITGARSFDHAEVTIGGIDVREIDPASLESHIVPGLYLTGEMVDVHGDLGGFNFQWAWSSGRLAGMCLGH